MTHLLLETDETRRMISLNKHPKLQELFLSSLPRSDVILHIKGTERAIIMFNLSHYQPETIFRSVNEFLYMISLPSLDSCFQNPDTGKFEQVLLSFVNDGLEKLRSAQVKMLLVQLQWLLGLTVEVQRSFAEYHSKRNPIERVHNQQ